MKITHWKDVEKREAAYRRKKRLEPVIDFLGIVFTAFVCLAAVSLIAAIV